MITTIPTMRENSRGKQYDSFRPFFLLVKITKGDAKGEILSRLAQGTVACYDTEKDAGEAQEKLHELADKIHGDFAHYGITCIVREETGEVFSVRSIIG